MAEERGHRIVRLDDLTEPQRRLVLALIDAGREAKSIGSRPERSPEHPAKFRVRP
jgi:hypothetical protein